MRAPFSFSHRLRVRWSEVDRQDIVFNPHYFTYFDVAVTEYWRALGFDYPAALAAAGTDIYALESGAQYHASAGYDDQLDIHVRCSHLGRSSMHLGFAIYRGEQHLTSGRLVYVHAEVATRQAAPWPEALREAIFRFERTPPEPPPARRYTEGA